MSLNPSTSALATGAIFQCIACLTPLSDTTHFSHFTPLLRTAVVRSVNDGCVLSESMSTSQSGDDLGSTFRSVSCRCGVVVGKSYVTTSRALDMLRDAYVLDEARVKMYTLGTECEKFPPIDPPPQQQQSENENAQEGDVPQFSQFWWQDWPQYQALIMNFGERLIFVEDRVGVSASTQMS